MNEKNVNSTKTSVQLHSITPIIDFNQFRALVVIYWKWFVLSVILCVFVAGLYLWITPPVLSVTGKMEIIDKSQKNGGGLSAGMAMLNSLPMGLGNALGGSFGGSLGIDAEKEIITSNTIVTDVVKDLGLYTEYRLKKFGRKRLLYQDQPINVSLDQAHVQWLDTELPVNYHQIYLTVVKSEEGYNIETTVLDNYEPTKMPVQSFATLPAIIKTAAGVLTITENQLTEKQAEQYKDGYTLKVSINPPVEVANDFIDRLSVEPPSKKIANILNITLQDQNLLRGIDFINHLVDAYNKRANDEKNEEASKTDEFVNARLAKIDSELGSSDAAWENSKKNFQIADPNVDAEEVMNKKSLYESKLVEIGTELQLHDYLCEYVQNPDNLYELIPVGIAGGMGNLSGNGAGKENASSNSSLIAQHNTLVSQRKELLRSMSDKAPQILRLTETIKDLHPTILMAMKRDRQNILLRRNAVEREYSKYIGRVNTAPKMERVLTEIGRQREIKQGVYLVMLQKREEIAMELANVTDKGKLIERTTLVKNSKKPQKKAALMFGLFIGLLLPLCILYILQILKGKIETPRDLSSLSKSPVIGEIPLSTNDEAIRNLRTNLLLSLEDNQKVILITSESQDDGKTYVANQLEESLKQIGKNVLLLNLDLRDNASNIASYLPELKNLHPADIFAREEFDRFIEQIKSQYDCVIIDTPAISKYADAYQIAKYANVTCFVVKASVTSKTIIEKVSKDNRLPNVKYVLNAIDMSKKRIKYYYKHLLSFLVFGIFLSSCGSSEKIVYLNNSDKVNLEIPKSSFEARIMPKDILSITVSTINPEAAKPFNLVVPTVVVGEVTTTTTQPVMQSYLVNNDGTIDFPVIGRIVVGGLTKNECEAMVLEKIRPYLAESEKPIVTVRMSSYSIAVLGEVKNPGSIGVSREKINIFEALALAGDMTIYGVRDRVRLIRENASGQKEIHMLDLTDANIINSPYYYLQQNDMLYVEPSKVKKQDARVGSMTNLWFSATSILVSLASIIVTIVK